MTFSCAQTPGRAPIWPPRRQGRAPQWRACALASVLACVLTGPTWAFDPVLPPGTEPSGTDTARSDYAMPTGSLAQGTLPTTVGQGLLTRRAWRRAGTFATLDLLTPITRQIEAAGYEVLFECATETCGGFDFRYQLTTLPEPQMHVDLGDFRFLAAQKPAPAGAEPELLGLLVSRSADFGFVQLWTLTPGGVAADAAPTIDPGQPDLPLVPVAPPVEAAAATSADPAAGPAATAAPADLIVRLESGLPVALEDLVFETGRAQLAEGDFASLQALAAWLAAHPAAQVTLVGHTDASGSLSGNLALSKQRAEAVRAWLIRQDGVAEGQLRAAGVGFLSPRASNLTEEGRTKNRRVEALLTSTP